MSIDPITTAYVFMLAIFVGFEVISKVPSTLHTPLMSGSNGISGLVIVAAILAASSLPAPVGSVLAFFAVALGAVNVVGGFAVTDRMLQMFRRRGGRS